MTDPDPDPDAPDTDPEAPDADLDAPDADPDASGGDPEGSDAARADRPDAARAGRPGPARADRGRPTRAGRPGPTRADRTGPARADGPGPARGEQAWGSGDQPDSSGRDLRTSVLHVTLGVLGLVAVAALFQFYVHAAAAIEVWIADRFRDLVLSAFNLVVLLVAAVGISLVLRELSDDPQSIE